VKVLVTGSAGMLGRNLMREFHSSSVATATGLSRQDLDLTDAKAVKKRIAEEKPDVVVHAAAKVGGIQMNVDDPVKFLMDNLTMDTNVLRACIDLGVENLLYLGSSCMYPKDYRQPLVESDILAAPLEPTNEGYAIAKIAGSKLCEYASVSYGLNYRTLIPSNLYGPGDNFSTGHGHLIAAAIRKVHDAKICGATEVEVWGSGLVRREFTYVGDLASWVASSISRVSELPPFLNLGLGVDYSVLEFYEAAIIAVGYEVSLVSDLSKPEGMKAKLMDSNLARTHHGWAPSTDLVDGTRKTYEWFLKSQVQSAGI